MDSPKLIAVVGLGGALAVGGFALLGAGIAIGLANAFPSVSLGVWLAMVGVMALIVGLIVVERGSAKTVEQVETELSLPNVMTHFPWWSAAIGGFGLLILYAAFRRSQKVAALDESASAAPTPSTRPSNGVKPAAEPERKTLVEFLAPLADKAVSNAVMVGLASLGIPTLTNLSQTVNDLMANLQSDKANGDEKKGHNGHHPDDELARMLKSRR